MKLARLFVLLIVVFIVGNTYAQDIPDAPNPPRLVNDFAGILNKQDVATLEQSLVQFNNETSTQIAVVTVKSLHGYDISEFSFELGEKWGIGQKGKDNGILVLVAPNERKTFIATGYGLEGVVPDAIAKRIVEQEMIPYFKQGDYYSGIASAVKTLMSLTKGEFTADDYAKKKGRGIPFIILFLFLGIVLNFIFRIKRARSYALGHNMSLWMALMLMSNSGGRSSRGGYNSFSSGSGGFGGFGGGSFGGGGAGGSW